MPILTKCDKCGIVEKKPKGWHVTEAGDLCVGCYEEYKKLITAIMDFRVVRK